MNPEKTALTQDSPSSPAGVRASAEPGRQLAAQRPILAIPVEPRPCSLVGRIADGLYRAAEVLLGLFALLIASPILLLIAMLIRLDSPGPILFFHRRAGRSVPRRGRELLHRTDLIPPEGGFDPDALYWAPATFWFVKFRTMHQDAAQRFPEFYWWQYEFDPDEIGEMYYKRDHDPRLTRFGRWLRKTSLDELPNFWNVVRGDVRLVGPRPEAPELLAYYTAEQLLKFTVHPGITCLSKVYGRGNLSVGEQIRWDLEYVRTRSLLLDLKTLWLTFWVVVAGKGAF